MTGRRRAGTLAVLSGLALIVTIAVATSRPSPAPAPSPTPAGSEDGETGAPTASSAQPSGAAPAPSGAAPAPSGTPRADPQGFAWSFVLPDDPELRRLLIMGSEIWIAGEGGQIRGVFAGPIELGGAEATLETAGERLVAELAGIPGASAVDDPVPVRLPAGDALRVTVQVGSTAFTGFAILHLGTPYRLVVAGYPESVVGAVAASLRFD